MNKKRIPLICFFLLISYISFPFKVSGQGTWSLSYGFHFRQINSVFINDYNNLCLVGGNKTNDSIQTIYLSNNAGTFYNLITDHVASWLKSVNFRSQSKGCAVGAYGKVLNTTDGGNTWNAFTLSGPMSQRHYNCIYYSDTLTGYIAGGIENFNPVSTLLKTTDGGNSWNMVLDTAGSWLTSVHFPTSHTGYAVGTNGVLYKSQDAGSTWSKKSIPGPAGTRNFNAVFFVSNTTGIIVGGNPENDSIQTILKTTDGGDSWQVLSDTIGPILNSVYFLNVLEGYAVGAKGTVLHTLDGGSSWQKLSIPENSASYVFNCVRFLNPNYGYIAGNSGVIYRYLEGSGEGPLAITLAATNISETSARLNAEVNANSYATAVLFEYGQTTAYGNVISSTPDTVHGTSATPVRADLTGLSPNTLYHYRIRATNFMATNYSPDKQFYTGISSIPNFNFELWDTLTIEVPDSIQQSGGKYTKISPACNGSYALRIEADSAFDSPGYILIGESDQGQSFTGGIPFSARPDSLVLCAEYSIIPDDTALVFILMKKNGSFVCEEFFGIFGNSGGNYQTLRFPINYLSPDTPDSLIFGMVATNLKMVDSLLFGSYLTVDNIRFSGTSKNIPNPDFENWTLFNHITLNDWHYNNKMKIKNLWEPLSVVISTDAYSGNYAALVRNVILPNDTIRGELFTSETNNHFFSLNYKPNYLTGYYKFFPENGDSLHINISIKSGNTWFGSGTFVTGNTVSDYTPFSIELVYSDTLTPDSAFISVEVFNNTYAIGNSYALLDVFNFDGFLAQIEENPFVKPEGSDYGFNIYPNPFSNDATITFTLDQPDKVKVMLYDITGRLVNAIADRTFDAGSNALTLYGNGLQKGLYVCVLIGKNINLSKKIVFH